MQTQDTKIVKALINNAINKGYTISVYDGEDYAVKRSMDAKEILEALEATDEEWLFIKRSDKTTVGNVMLVHGNEDGVILADWSVNEAMEEIIPRELIL